MTASDQKGYCISKQKKETSFKGFTEPNVRFVSCANSQDDSGQSKGYKGDQKGRACIEDAQDNSFGLHVDILSLEIEILWSTFITFGDHTITYPILHVIL